MPIPKRIQRKRTKGWKSPPATVHCSRPGKFGNPFRTAEAFRVWIERGEVYLSEIIDPIYFPWRPSSARMLANRRREILDSLDELRQAQHLSCFCMLDKPCHVDVLIELVNR